MTQSELMLEIERLRQENAALKAQPASKLSMRVSDAGYVEVYGLPGKGRYSVSLTPDGWSKLFDKATVDQIQAFVKANKQACEGKLSAYRSAKAVG